MSGIIRRRMISDRLDGRQKRVIKREDLERVTMCGVCGGRRFKNLSEFSKECEINFVQCSHCKAVTYDKKLRQDKLDELYAQYEYYDGQNEEGENVTFYGCKRFAKHLYKLFKRAGGRKKKQMDILDFGGGDGSMAAAFAEYLLQYGYCKKIRIMVVDYCTRLCVPGSKAVRIERTDSLELLSEKAAYDFVIASAVMEHLQEPGVSAKKIFDMLKEGGIVYFRTPYKYPLKRILEKAGFDLDMEYPEHIWDFGGDSWWRRLTKYINYTGNNIITVCSRPSIVEKTFSSHFFVAFISYMMKAPWYIWHKWPYVGGWETVYKKKES